MLDRVRVPLWRLLAASFLFGALVGAGLEALPPYAEICEVAEGGQKQCTSYSVAPFFLIQVFKFLDSHNGVLTAVATIAIAWFTLSLRDASKEQGRITDAALKLAQEEFNSTHRPRMRVRNVVVKAPIPVGQQQPPPIAANHAVIGQLYVSNVGDADGEITESYCMVHWTDKPLPMERPYEGQLGNEFLPESTLVPGGSTVGEFMSDKLLDVTAAKFILAGGPWKLYVLGWVAYKDKAGRQRRTAFCREYTPLLGTGEGRFFPVGDPDYEHEE